ncbi:putative phage-type endonuclease [Pandoraea pnomenusa]|uniref:Putative phage-type endonuclease n=1 Tax=Pandoraea pnomenusa TaxID=93220 RepID=A0A378YM23_9BURK|nr:putative phage-type endonuclease [Pandoraea pnomenusa]
MALPESVGCGRHRPALRLVETKDLSRDDWLEVRKNGIGGSDAAAAVGLSPYMSPLELWLIKTGRDTNLPRPDPQDTTEPVFWGVMLEPIVAASYTKQTGNTPGSTPAASFLRASSRFSRAAANGTSGYTPKASRFSLPKKRYLSRQYFPPDGETSRYMPPISKAVRLFTGSGFANRDVGQRHKAPALQCRGALFSGAFGN